MEMTEVTKPAEKAEKHTKEHSHRTQSLYYRPEIETLRMVLMLCALFYTFRLHRALGDFNAVIFGFAFPALYITCGYLVLRESHHREQRLRRAIGRTAICFAILFAVYLGLSLLFDAETTLATLSRGSFWFDFLVLNKWDLPVGSTIWYFQALLYAYIIVYVMYKLKLEKLDIYVAVFCLIVTVFTGEFASIVGFSFRGRTYLGGNFLTRALPYILIGAFIHRKKDAFRLLKPKHYWFIAFGGLALTVGEYLLLALTGKNNYVGHLLGMGLLAFDLCLVVFFTGRTDERSKFFRRHTRVEVMIPFFVVSPIYYGLLMLLDRISRISDGVYTVMYYISGFSAILAIGLSFLIMAIYCLIVKHADKTPKKPEAENMESRAEAAAKLGAQQAKE